MCQHTPCLFIRTQAQDGVGYSTHLEGAHPLKILALEIQGRTGDLIQQTRLHDRCVMDEAADPVPRLKEQRCLWQDEFHDLNVAKHRTLGHPHL